MLFNVEEKNPTPRLLAAIAYKNGVTETELAGWYDVERRTIYSRLKRLEHEHLSKLSRTITGQVHRES